MTNTTVCDRLHELLDASCRSISTHMAAGAPFGLASLRGLGDLQAAISRMIINLEGDRP